MRITLSQGDIAASLGIEAPDLPTYASPLMNLANQYAAGTRPAVVGQMSELIQDFPGESVGDWEAWYEQAKPNAIEKATDKVMAKLEAFRTVLQRIDRTMVASWVRDLVISKTYQGLKFQQAILARIAADVGKTYRLAVPSEESAGIDGYVGETAVSIKPDTYHTMAHLAEDIPCCMVLYSKTSRGIVFDFNRDEFL